MKKFLAIASVVLVAACQNTNNTNTTYEAGQIGQASDVSEGKIVSMRAVQLKRDNTVGTAGGAIVGGALGSQIGGNDAVAVAGAVGGAVLGGLIGDQVEGAMNNTDAIEFIVKKTTGKTVAVVQTNEEGLKIGDKVLIIDSTKYSANGTIKLAKDN
jgi:outer membrane lipoprotein SlyB